jgi:hypothetical protein
MPSYPKLKAPVRQVISLLAHGDYKALEKLTNGVRLSAAEMAEAVREYGGGLILPPEDSFDNLDVVEVQGARPREWSVNVDLWTAGEGQSDLTLELTLRESGKEVFDVEIDNIHVL